VELRRPAKKPLFLARDSVINLDRGLSSSVDAVAPQSSPVVREEPLATAEAAGPSLPQAAVPTAVVTPASLTIPPRSAASYGLPAPGQGRRLPAEAQLVSGTPEEGVASISAAPDVTAPVSHDADGGANGRFCAPSPGGDSAGEAALPDDLPATAQTTTSLLRLESLASDRAEDRLAALEKRLSMVGATPVSPTTRVQCHDGTWADMAPDDAGPGRLVASSEARETQSPRADASEQLLPAELEPATAAATAAVTVAAAAATSAAEKSLLEDLVYEQGLLPTYARAVFDNPDRLAEDMAGALKDASLADVTFFVGPARVRKVLLTLP